MNMKRINFLTVVLLFIVGCALNSCTSDENLNSGKVHLESNVVAESQLIMEIKSLNDSLLTQTRGRGWSRRDWMKVCVADIGGAYSGGKGGAVIGGKVGTIMGNPITGAVFGAAIGGIICGAGNSWLNAPSSRAISATPDVYAAITTSCKVGLDGNLIINTGNIVSKTPDGELKMKIDDTTLSKVKLSEDQLKVGKMHNAILSYLDGSVVVNKENLEIKDSSLCAIVDAPEMKELYNKTINDCKQGKINKETAADYAISLFEDVFTDYVAITDDVVYIINKYIDILDKPSSGLTDDEKTWIKNGLATALYSYNYWNTVYSNTNK